MTVDQLVEYLRLNVSIQDPEVIEKDPAYLSMTDEQLVLYLEVALKKDFPEVPSLEDLPEESIYVVLLLAKKELFYALAVKEAPLYDLGADGGFLKRSQRFEHYMELVAKTTAEYDNFKESGGAGGNTLVSYDVLLSNRYNTKRNYEKGKVPTLYLSVKNITPNSAEILWRVQLQRFKSYKVYISESPIVDLCNVSRKISEKAKLLTTITDVHQTLCRVEGLVPNTLYYVAVSASEKSSLTGYKQTSFKTAEPVVVSL